MKLCCLLILRDMSTSIIFMVLAEAGNVMKTLIGRANIGGSGVLDATKTLLHGMLCGYGRTMFLFIPHEPSDWCFATMASVAALKYFSLVVLFKCRF